MLIKTKPTMKKDTTKEPSMGTKDGMKHLRQPRHPRQNAGILPFFNQFPDQNYFWFLSLFPYLSLFCSDT